MLERFFKNVFYSTLLHVPPLRFYCVGICWDLTQTSQKISKWAVLSKEKQAHTFPQEKKQKKF
jgi:hypothetical protein